MVMKKTKQTRIILIALVILIFIGAVLTLFFVIKNEETKMSEDEVKKIVGEITDDEILTVHYYNKCFVQDKEYEKVYITVTKLKEKFVHGMMGEFEYKYYFLDKNGNIFSEQYNPDDKMRLCEKLE